uniref:Uncharacterized protein n=1 Tax=Utricularia reniformis TaxID=192314 RepID=A0A1Y0B372_9LAMI|nr:hypothetical protein AEK19_MT1649 [Utricularia reniformis]ART31833.1 hypothetical protein AEK19_MT1649 [Utricularia reniformis]
MFIAPLVPVDGKEKGRLSSSVTMEKPALNMTFVPNEVGRHYCDLETGATRYVTLLGRRCAHHNETWVAIISSLVGLLLKSNSRNKMLFFEKAVGFYEGNYFTYPRYTIASVY